MPVRLVNAQDLIDNPELNSQGISVNMNYDFPEPVNEVPPVAKEEQIQEATIPIPEKKAKQTTQSPKPSKHKAKRK